MSTTLPLASFIADFWNDQLVDHHRQGVFLVLVGFVGSFAFIRMSTRMIRAEVSWWPGNIESESGLHVHHLVFGIVTMMAAGTVAFSALGASPLTEICAFFFGVGAGLTIDEFALWVYLEDVYWADEGRSSIDATVIGASLIGLIVLGANPFEFSGGPEEVIGGVVSALLAISFVAICFMKQRNLHGIVGILFTPIVARTVRSAVLSERQLDYVTAAKLRGESGFFILSREIFPNVLGPTVVEMTVRFGYAIFTVATLSFLGVGLQPPSPDWGLSVSQEYTNMISGVWWSTLFPALAIASTVIAVNLIADSLQSTLSE